jgi:hypothetical protein
MSDEELDLDLAGMQIMHEIGHGLLRV